MRAVYHSSAAQPQSSTREYYTLRTTQPEVEIGNGWKPCFKASFWLITNMSKDSRDYTLHLVTIRVDAVSSVLHTFLLASLFLQLLLWCVSLFLSTDVVLYSVVILCQMTTKCLHINRCHWMGVFFPPHDTCLLEILCCTFIKSFFYSSIVLCQQIHVHTVPRQTSNWEHIEHLDFYPRDAALMNKSWIALSSASLNSAEVFNPMKPGDSYSPQILNLLFKPYTRHLSPLTPPPIPSLPLFLSLQHNAPPLGLLSSEKSIHEMQTQRSLIHSPEYTPKHVCINQTAHFCFMSLEGQF